MFLTGTEARPTERREGSQRFMQQGQTGRDEVRRRTQLRTDAARTDDEDRRRADSLVDIGSEDLYCVRVARHDC